MPPLSKAVVTVRAQKGRSSRAIGRSKGGMITKIAALTDITYIPMRRGFLYLVAVRHWATRRVLSWRLSNTMDVEFCIAVLEESPLARFGPPGIFNSGQESQFTSQRFTEILGGVGVRISMDGRGRWMDNVFIERLWRSLKYECVYLPAFETRSELRAGLARWMINEVGPHSAHGGITPDEAYAAIGAGEKETATLAA